MIAGKDGDSMDKSLFDAFVLIASGPHQGSATITYCTDNATAALMV